jgi:hypothetical protein
MGFVLVIGSIGHLQNVTTNNYNSPTELDIPKITVIIMHIKSSVFTNRCFLTASNGVCPTSLEFPTCPRLRLQTSHFPQL